MDSTAPTTTTASLHYREGNSDKVYQAAIERQDDGFIVTYAYGRRGNTLTTGAKTSVPVPLATATRLFDKLVSAKLAKGYTPSEDGTPYRQTGDEGRDSGIRCQLLNPVEESELGRLLTDNRHCLQQKHDGRRMLVRKQGDDITGINRRGLLVALPDPIRHAVAELPYDVLIDGEAVGDTLHAFDLLEYKGNDIRARRFFDRFAALILVIPPNLPALRWISTVIHPYEKLETYEELKATGAEGVVFKDVDAPFTPGRPNSGGPQLKFKFVESASFVVLSRNPQRSVTLGLYPAGGDTPVPAGNVTIPPNHEVPAPGDVVDAKYLYAFRESGAVYQPVYLGKREDIPASECVVEQLKYKAESQAT
jgi:bifunctional non-homologous end joining protein LigD